MQQEQIHYGISGIDKMAAEMLFVDPNVTVDDAEQFAAKIRSGKNLEKL